MPHTSKTTGGANGEKEQYGLFVLYPSSEDVDINMEYILATLCSVPVSATDPEPPASSLCMASEARRIKPGLRTTR